MISFPEEIKDKFEIKHSGNRITLEAKDECIVCIIEPRKRYAYIDITGYFSSDTLTLLQKFLRKNKIRWTIHVRPRSSPYC